MVTEQKIIDACLFLKSNPKISNDVSNFIQNSSLEKLEALSSINYEKLFKKFKAQDIEALKQECKNAQIDFEILIDFVKYRNEIKVVIKTIRPLKMFLCNLIEIREAGFDIIEAIKFMKDREWYTVELKFIKDKLSKNTGTGLAQFGFEPKIGGLYE